MKLRVDTLTRLKEVIKEKKNRPFDLLNSVFYLLNFKDVEIKLYNLLLKKPLTINEIERKLSISDRTIREYIKGLLEKGFITREVLKEKRLKYTYSSVPITEGWKRVKNEVEEIVREINKVFSKLKS